MAQAITTERERGSSQAPRGALMGPSVAAKIPEEFKGLQRFQQENDIQIIRGAGAGFAEVFFEDEPRNPLPGQNVVEVRLRG